LSLPASKPLFFSPGARRNTPPPPPPPPAATANSSNKHPQQKQQPQEQKQEEQQPWCFLAQGAGAQVKQYMPNCRKGGTHTEHEKTEKALIPVWIQSYHTVGQPKSFPCSLNTQVFQNPPNSNSYSYSTYKK